MGSATKIDFSDFFQKLAFGKSAISETKGTWLDAHAARAILNRAESAGS